MDKHMDRGNTIWTKIWIGVTLYGQTERWLNKLMDKHMGRGNTIWTNREMVGGRGNTICQSVC